MIDFGATPNHTNGLGFPILSNLNSMSNYSMATWIILNAAPTIGVDTFFSKKGGGNAGWRHGLDSLRRYDVRHNDGSNANFTRSGGTQTIGVLTSMVAVWDGSDVIYYFGGVLDSTDNLTRTIELSNEEVTVGNRVTFDSGLACALGHMMIWDVALSADEVAQYHNGSQPQQGNLVFWTRGTSLPTIDEVSGVPGTIVGTMTLREAIIDVYYQMGSVISTNPTVEPIRQRLSRRLRIDRLQHLKPVITGGFELLRTPLLKQLHASHPFGPEENATGWGRKVWERRLLRPIRHVIDLEAMTVSSTTRDLRDYLARFWVLALATTRPSSERLQGIPELTTGFSQRVVARATEAFIEGDSNLIRRITANSLKTEKFGVVMEGCTFQKVKNPAFINGLTDWTLINNGVNGSSIAIDTEFPLYESSVSPNVAKIVAGDPLGGNDYGIEGVTNTLTAGRHSFSFDHAQGGNPLGTTAPISVRIQKSDDSEYLRFSDNTWQVAVTYNDIDNELFLKHERFVFPSFNLDADAALTIRIVQRTTQGNIHYIGHVQLEDGPIVTSRWPFHEG